MLFRSLDGASLHYVLELADSTKDRWAKTRFIAQLGALMARLNAQLAIRWAQRLMTGP